MLFMVVVLALVDTTDDERIVDEADAHAAADDLVELSFEQGMFDVVVVVLFC